MKTAKILLTAFLAILTLTGSVFASDAPVTDIPEPQEVVASIVDSKMVIEKIYVMPKGSDESVIPKDNFIENEIIFVYDEVKVTDNSKEESKEHTENVSYNTSTNDAETVVALFAPSLDVSTEDGYTGTLTFDHSTLELVPAGYSSRKFTVSEERNYPNLASADTSLVPKTIDKDGVTLTLANIEWVSSVGETVDGTEVPVRYTANAVYTGTATKTYVNGYTASADYKGTVTKILDDTVTYTVVFKEEMPIMITDDKTTDTDVTKKDNKVGTTGIVVGSIAGIAVLSAGGYTLYRFIRKKRKGY